VRGSTNADVSNQSRPGPAWRGPTPLAMRSGRPLRAPVSDWSGAVTVIAKPVWAFRMPASDHPRRFRSAIAARRREAAPASKRQVGDSGDRQRVSNVELCRTPLGLEVPTIGRERCLLCCLTSLAEEAARIGHREAPRIKTATRSGEYEAPQRRAVRREGVGFAQLEGLPGLEPDQRDDLAPTVRVEIHRKRLR